jgi:hypothetical protein
MVGTRLTDILGGSTAPNNPRIMTFIVINEVGFPLSGGGDLLIVEFATAYISSVQNTFNGVSFTATFLPPETGGHSASVAFID